MQSKSRPSSPKSSLPIIPLCRWQAIFCAIVRMLITIFKGWETPGIDIVFVHAYDGKKEKLLLPG